MPNTFKQAMKSNKSKEWKAAINEELANMRWKSVWTVKRLPKAQRALGAWWVFAKKPNHNGTTRYKARDVTKGFNQHEDTGYAHCNLHIDENPSHACCQEQTAYV
jgi:hypothetical protein